MPCSWKNAIVYYEVTSYCGAYVCAICICHVAVEDWNHLHSLSPSLSVLRIKKVNQSIASHDTLSFFFSFFFFLPLWAF